MVAPAGMPAAAISAAVNNMLLREPLVVEVAEKRYTGLYKVFAGTSVPVPICTVTCAEETFENKEAQKTPRIR
jgi:hypothetical protein